MDEFRQTPACNTHQYVPYIQGQAAYREGPTVDSFMEPLTQQVDQACIKTKDSWRVPSCRSTGWDMGV